MKFHTKITILIGLVVGLISLAVLAEGPSPFKQSSKEMLHCVSGYIDCDALKSCIAEASSRQAEADCITAQASRLVEEEGFEAAASDDPLQISDIPEGERSALAMLGSRLSDLEVLSAPNDCLLLEGGAVVGGNGAIIDPIRQKVFPYGLVILRDETEGDAGVEDAGEVEPEPLPEVAEAPPKPKKPAAPKLDVSEFPDADQLEEKRPFSKGDMEIGLGLGLAGDGIASYLGVGGKFAYYVLDKLAPGIDLNYTHIFADESLGIDYPESLTLLPFLKYVITQKTVAPYVFVKGGYDIEWGTDFAVNAWVLGLGGGVHVSVGKRFTINIELAGLHYWYSGTKQYGYEDDSLLAVNDERSRKVLKSECSGDDCGPYSPATPDEPLPEGGVLLVDRQGNEYLCTDPELCGSNTRTDKKDVEREWFFPQVTLGFGVIF